MGFSLTREQARLLDRYAMTALGVPGLILMENAGRGMAEVLLALGVRGPVVIACGKGNNGGDGLVIARHLDKKNIPIRILLFCVADELRGDAAVNHAICEKLALPIEYVSPEVLASPDGLRCLAEAEWIVDALFGSGLQGAVRSPFDRVIGAINESAARKLAVDLPSGLDADTGVPLGICVRADHTATVMASKVGFAAATAQPWLGKVHVVDMGIPERVMARFLSEA